MFASKVQYLISNTLELYSCKKKGLNAIFDMFLFKLYVRNLVLIKPQFAFMSFHLRHLEVKVSAYEKPKKGLSLKGLIEYYYNINIGINYPLPSLVRL